MTSMISDQRPQTMNLGVRSLNLVGRANRSGDFRAFRLLGGHAHKRSRDALGSKLRRPGEGWGVVPQIQAHQAASPIARRGIAAVAVAPTATALAARASALAAWRSTARP